MRCYIYEYHTYEPRIFGWSTPIEDMYPYIDREESSNMLSSPLMAGKRRNAGCCEPRITIE